MRGSGGRTIQLHPQERLLQEARALQASPEFQEARTRRQAVEHRIARLMQLGLRQARYCGLAKTLFQACLAATVANLTLLAAGQAAAAQVGALVVASVVLLWALLGASERPGAPRRAIVGFGGPDRTAPRAIAESTASARWQLGFPASRLETAACRPGF